MSYGLTRDQLDCFLVIEEWIARYGVAPTFREIQWELQLASQSRAAALVRNLDDCGWLTPRRRGRGHARSIAEALSS